MREFRPMPTAPKAMRHIGQGDKRGDQEASQSVSFSQTVSLVSDRLAFAENGESSPYPRHSQVIKRRAPRRAKRMRHIEKKRSVFLRSEKSLKPSHSANMREFRPMPTTPTAMRHFGQADKKGEPEGLSNRLIFSNRLTRLKPSHVPRKRRVGTLPSSLRRISTPSPVVGEGWGEDARPPHEAKPPTRTRRIRGHTRTTCYNPQYTLRNGDPRP